MNQETISTQTDATVTPKAIRVASVLDSSTVVLNVGRLNGISANTSFLIYGKGEEVIDPESHENLGILEIVRGRGKVTHLQDRFCTVESVSTRIVPGAKKTIRRERTGLNRNLFGQMTPVEEIEEGARTVDVPFDNVIVGDFARKI